MITTEEDASDPEVLEYLRTFEHMSKLKSSIYSRKKLYDNLEKVERSYQLEQPPSQYNTDNISPYESPYQQFDFQKDSIVLLASASNPTNWNTYLEILVNSKVKSSVLVMAGNMDVKQVGQMENSLDELSKNGLFYWVYNSPDILDDDKRSSMVWNQVITLIHYKKAIISRLRFNPSNDQLIEEYNLQGTHLFSTTTTFPPYTDMPVVCRECRPMKKCPQCSMTGMVADLLNIVGAKMNFTWESHENPENKVGSSPVSGPANASGAWEGTLGDIFYGDYQMSADAWNEKLERSDMFDFVSFVSDRTILTLKPQAANLDLWLFTRPFRNEVWGVIGLITVVLIVIFVAPYYISKKLTTTSGHRMIESIGWLFFLLISVYYDGALTMFFSTEVSISFNTIRDVIRAYDDWKLMMMSGNEVHFIYYVQDGDPDFVEFWDRKLNKPEETMYDSPEQGIEIMQTDRVVLHIQESSLKGHLVGDPSAGFGMKLFGASKPEYFNFMLNNNSPIGPMLRLGLQQMAESGVMAHVEIKWTGKDIGSDTSTNLDQTLMLLTPRQLVFVFFVLLCFVIIALVILSVELIIGAMFGKKD